MQRLNNSVAGYPDRPTARIMQFGNGNFFRGFFAWNVDRLNDAGGDWGIIAIRSQGQVRTDGINAQDGLFTTLERGVGQDGAPVSDTRLVRSLLREYSALEDWIRILGLARDPAITVVSSNTTEAGIVYTPETWPDAAAPASFPARVARLLWERWSALGKENAPGWHFLPCELIEHNGQALRDAVLSHARHWALDTAFVEWIASANVFFDTLVDRIVPGYPADEAAAWHERLGYEDSFLTAVEHYHLFLIEQRAGMPAPVLPLADSDRSGTRLVADLAPHRECKVAVLNGAHTALCPLALLTGVETVGQAMDAPALRAYLDRLLAVEVLPYLDLPHDVSSAFAEDVLRRFANPFIRHRWFDISLNGVAKFRTRNMPRLQAALNDAGEIRMTALALAAWMRIYSGLTTDGTSPVAPRDADNVIAVARRIGQQGDAAAVVAAWLREPTFWGGEAAVPESDLTRAETAILDAYRFLGETPLTLERLATYVEQR